MTAARSEVLERIKATGDLNSETEEMLKNAICEYKDKFLSGR